MKRNLVCLLAALVLALSAFPGVAEEVVDLVYLYSTDNFDPETDFTRQLILEELGVNILPEMGIEDDKLNLVLMSEQEYDAIKMNYDLNLLASYISNGAVQDLTDLVEEYGPNLKEAFSQDVWDMVSVDGRIYAIPETDSNDIENGIVVRKDWLELLGLDKAAVEAGQKAAEALGLAPCLDDGNGYLKAEATAYLEAGVDEEAFLRAQAFARDKALEDTDRETYKAMVALIHNLNTMHSRAGAQTPFSSINYGMDVSAEGRMVMKNVLLATEAGLGHGETPIFPIQIFRVKEGVNYNPGDPNYDLFRLACRCSAKRLFPNFSFLDAPFNLAYYKPGHYETEVGYMGCRTRVMGNVYDPDNQIAPRRGNLSFTTINLPRIAILANGNIEWFFDELDRKIDLCVEQLLERFAIQCKKKVCNYPFLMGEGCWLGSENLGWNDEVGEVLKHGTLSVGFIGLAECLKALIGQHHGESQRAQNLGLEIISHMRKRMDDISQARKLNVTLLATPAEGLSGRFVKLDRKRFGALPGITDREYYTNSFHVPVYFPIGAFDKIRLEAPYHALTNAGHISYVELDGDTAQNLEAFERIVRCMKEAGIGYGSINHPVDRDGVCGYNGIIGDTCPRCGRAEHEGPHFQRIRRITGYLVGTMDKWNDAKRAEEAQRVKHSL